jgi:phosphinothricin acetyltransferase
MTIRPGRESDAAGINAVYNRYILESPATFETEPISDKNRRVWLAWLAKDPRYPVMVAENDAGVCGFANAAPFDQRDGYGTSVKTSVFVASDCLAKGVGRALYAGLFDALAGVDLHRAYGLIVAPNPASVALHKAFGFVHVATLDEVGRKFGRYHSVMWFQKRL